MLASSDTPGLIETMPIWYVPVLDHLDSFQKPNRLMDSLFFVCFSRKLSSGHVFDILTRLQNATAARQTATIESPR